MVGIPLEIAAPLDLFDDRRIEADAGVEEEVAPIHRAEPDPPNAVRGDGAKDEGGGLDGVVGEPDGAGEHVRRSAGETGEGRVGARQPVGDLVQRAVATEHRNDFDAASGGRLRQTGGVAPATGLGHADVVFGRQGLFDDHASPRGDR